MYRTKERKKGQNNREAITGSAQPGLYITNIMFLASMKHR
jgi:hypothetical protein